MGQQTVRVEENADFQQIALPLDLLSVNMCYKESVSKRKAYSEHGTNYIW